MQPQYPQGSCGLPRRMSSSCWPANSTGLICNLPFREVTVGNGCLKSIAEFIRRSGFDVESDPLADCLGSAEILLEDGKSKLPSFLGFFEDSSVSGLFNGKHSLSPFIERFSPSAGPFFGHAPKLGRSVLRDAPHPPSGSRPINSLKAVWPFSLNLAASHPVPILTGAEEA